jgi:hypothetical protein
MSTRCQIGVYETAEQKLSEPTALLYRHSDGYPGELDGSAHGVLADVVPFVKHFGVGRGYDPEYLAARLMQHLCNEYDKAVGSGSAGFLGYGICRAFHGDINYFYAIRPGSLTVYKTPFDSEPSEWKAYRVIELEK